ncbi:MAG: NAD(P)H-dependent oxidoreductase [Robiginitalea sp.]
MAGILATAGSNSSSSINFQLVRYTGSLVSDFPVNLLELARYEIPMYRADLEKSSGIPEVIKELQEQISEAGGLILSVNEHNSYPSAFFKNTLDWLSRADRNFMSETAVYLMSTSGGRRGGTSSRSVMEQMLPRFGGKVVSSFSLPQFYENFDPEAGITDPGLASEHGEQLEKFLNAL